MRTSRHYSLVCHSLCLVVPALFLLFFSGCATTTPTARYIVAIDRSESTDPMRLDQLRDITLARQAALAHNAELELLFFDSGSSRIYGPRVPNDSKAIKLQKQSFLIPDLKHLRTGTRPAALLEALDKEIPDMQGKDIRLLIYTDGDNDFANDRARIKAATQALGALPKLKIAVIGVHPENDDWWKTLVAPAVGGRLTLAAPADHAQATGQALAP